MEIIVIIILLLIIEKTHWDIQAVIFLGAIIALIVTPGIFSNNINSKKSSDTVFCITFSCIFFLTFFICFFSKHIIMAILSLIISGLLTTGIKKQTKNKLKKEKINCPDNTIVLSNPKILGYNYRFYTLTMNYDYEGKRKLQKIENVSIYNFHIYKKIDDKFECIFSNTLTWKTFENKYVFPIDSIIDDYYFFFLVSRQATNKDHIWLEDIPNNINYAEDFIIANNAKGYVYAENFARIIDFNQNMECLYSTYNDSKSDKASLYLWQPDKGTTCITPDFMYGLYYSFSNTKFLKTLKYPFIEDNLVNIYFYKKECDLYYILMELASKADDFEILENKFKDDTTVNYRVKFNKKRTDDIALFYYSMVKTLNYSGHIKVADFGLFNNDKILPTCGGTAIYDVPFIDYFKGLDGDLKVFNTISQFQLSKEQKEYYRNLVNTIYSKYNLPVNFDKLPDDFIKDCIFEDLQYSKLYEYLERQYIKTHEIYNFRTLDDVLKEKCKAKYNLIKQDLIARKVIKSKWKSELELFRLVYKHYPNAIYQYRANWLGLQSLDIFIPNLRVGIEYQGEQHYKPVELFGGKEGFQKRQELDERKRKLCIENNVKLIEWKYDEPITKMTLDNKIQQINCKLITCSNQADYLQ